MARAFADDRRIDPRLRALFGSWTSPPVPDLADPAPLLAALAGKPAPHAAVPYLPAWTEQEYEAVAPSTGLSFEQVQVPAGDGGPALPLQVVRPERPTSDRCVYYVHGGGMMTGSSQDANYRAWARLVAAQGVTVVLPDFRNSLRPSSLEEVAPYPAGLSDVVRGLRWVRGNAGSLGVDPSVVLAGDSGGANLAVATALSLSRDGDLDPLRGLFLLCPYLSGAWPARAGSSALENDGILLDVTGNFARVVYGRDAFEAGDPLAWAGFATEADLAGFPPVVVHVNECDPLRDDGVDLYRRLLQAGVSARCRQAMGTVHGTEVYVLPCPDLSRDAARDLAALAADC